MSGCTSPRVPETIDFMLAIGMREVVRGEDFAVLEMRGGTHLVVTGDPIRLCCAAVSI